MTTRERNLSILLGSALLVVGALVGFKSFQAKGEELRAEIRDAEAELKQNEFAIKFAEGRDDLAEFLEKNEPKEAQRAIIVEDQLLKVCQQKLSQNRLETIKSPRISDPAPGEYYHRKRVSLNVRGVERDMILFLTQLSDPKSFRSVTRLTLKPMPGDETNTKVDAVVEVDQWFIPKGNEAVEDLPEEPANSTPAPTSPPAPTTPTPQPAAPTAPGLPPGLKASQS